MNKVVFGSFLLIGLLFLNACIECKDCDCLRYYTEEGFEDVIFDTLVVKDACSSDLEEIEGTNIVTHQIDTLSWMLRQECDCF